MKLVFLHEYTIENTKYIIIQVIRFIRWYLWATSANSSLQTNSIIFAAFGWAPSTPCSSCPFATLARSSLCLLTIESLSSFNSLQNNWKYVKIQTLMKFSSCHIVISIIELQIYLACDSSDTNFPTRFLRTLLVNAHSMIVSKTCCITPFIVKLLNWVVIQIYIIITLFDLCFYKISNCVFRFL